MLVLTLLSRSRWFLEHVGMSVLWMLAAICFLKLCVIVEFDATVEIYLARVLNPVNDVIRSLGGETDADLERKLLCIWLLGSAAVSLVKLPIAIHGCWMVSRIPVTHDQRVLEFLKEKNDVSLRVVITQMVETPCVVGIRRETILLPDVSFTEKELRLILEHEYAHIRHHDKWIDLSTQMLCVLFWWNPAVYLLRGVVMNLCDFYCDREVLRGSSPSQRRFYCKTILSCASSGRVAGRCFAGSALKSRLHLILGHGKPGKIKTGIVSAAMAAVAFTVSYALVFQPQGEIVPGTEDFSGSPVAERDIEFRGGNPVAIVADGTKYFISEEQRKLF